MSSTPFLLPRQTPVNGSGRPYPSSTITVYRAGTTTLATIYSDSARAVPLQNPLTSNSAGKFPPVYLDPSYNVRVIHKTSSGVTLSDDDDIGTTTELTAAAVGQALYPRTDDEISAGVTPTYYGYAPGDVRRYGAVGDDGVTDDTAAIQNAVSGARTVTFPPGTYKVTSTVTVPANTDIHGYGATVSTASQITVFQFTDGGGMYGLTIAGPASATYNANGIAIKCSGTNNSSSAPTFVTAPIIADCTIRNFGIYGVYFAYTNNGSVRNTVITGIGYTGIGGVSCNDMTVCDNVISTIGPGPGTGDAYGVFIDRLNGTSETADPRSYRCSIVGNSVSSVVATGGVNGQGIDTHAGVDFTITGNNVVGCQVGIAVTASSISSTPQLGPKRVSVTGNVIDGLSVGYGILVSGAIQGSTINEYAQQIVIDGNVILNHGATNDSLNGGIISQGTKGCVISNNVVRNAKSVGINLLLENIAVSVTGNSITDPYDSTFAAPCCLRISGNNVSGFIGGNTFAFEDASLGTYVAVESIRVATSLTGTNLDFGRCHFNGIDATHLTAFFLSAGARYSGLFHDSGATTITVTSGGATGYTDVTFSKRFPYTPKVEFTPRYPFNGGGKFPLIGVDTSTAITATGFRIYAAPYDGATWTASGSLSVDWTAN